MERSRFFRDDIVKVKVRSGTERVSSIQRHRKTRKTAKARPVRKPQPPVKEKDLTFEDKLSRFMKESNERNDTIRHRENKRGSSHRSRGKNAQA